ncbi:MAG: cyclic nucleotide-binding domain-containing protein [Sandaracinaceae bacterium]|nr:cyclic nucleotide-binding domain-containing protein [Sandaracinaceae bacterium]
MKTLGDIRARADSELYAGRYLEALHLYAVVLTLMPHHLDARLRVADALLALGEIQRAAVVYTAFARHCANGGHPLRALVAIKVLTTLEPLLAPLLRSLSDLYARGSTRLGRGIRVAPSDEDHVLPDDFSIGACPPRDKLAPHAERLGADLSRAGQIYPEKLPPIPLFSELEASAFERVLYTLKLRRTRPGEVIVAEGEPGHSFFVIARGTVAVEKHLAQGGTRRLATLHEGAIFGEMALVSASPRTASVVAASDCDLLEFDREALAAASHDVATVAAALDQFTRERLLNNLLATAPLFRPLDRRQRLDLVRRFTAHDVAAGVTILEEGTAGRGLFLLLSGEVDVSKRDGSEKVLLATLGPGELFGEMSLTTDEPTSASVTAATQSTVLFLAKEVFERLVEAVPEIREYVRDLAEERRMDTRLLLEAAWEDEELAEDDGVLI